MMTLTAELWPVEEPRQMRARLEQLVNATSESDAIDMLRQAAPRCITSNHATRSAAT